MTQDRLLRDQHVAEILACGRATVWRMVADGRLPRPMRIGGITRWRLSDVQQIIKNKAEEVA